MAKKIKQKYHPGDLFQFPVDDVTVHTLGRSDGGG